MHKVEHTGHQGDVVFFRIDEFPVGDRKTDDQTKQGILAYGEASGHAHQFVDESLASIELFRVMTEAHKDLLFAEVREPATIEHGRARDFEGEEADHDYHKPVTLTPGKYLIGIVEETDWINKTIRRVVD